MAAVTSRLEDYLEALFHLETSGRKQTVTALAENLKLTKGTITTVIKKMAEQGLVIHESYGAIRLTAEGRRIGWQVFMKHERLTSFFHDFLGENFDRSEEIACLIEHHLTGPAANRFFNLVDSLLQAQESKQEWTAQLLSCLNQSSRLAAPLTILGQKAGNVVRLTGDEKMITALADLGIVKGCFLNNIGLGVNEYYLSIGTKAVSLPFNLAATVWIG